MLPRSKKIILLIESDLQVAATIMKWLRDFAHVTHLSTAPAADILATIAQEPWDLVITDIKLPLIDDLEVTRMVKSVNIFTPVLIVTEHQKISFILTALTYHADGLQFKPLVKKEFLELVYKLIAEHETRLLKESKIILAIGAHPDDVEIGCAGTLAWHLSKGDTLHILTLSQGESGGDPLIRKQEAEYATRMQGAQLHLANFTDTDISEGITTIQHIEELVAKIMPTHVYTHSLHDNHKDHRNVHLATISACRQIPNLYCYQSPSSSVNFRPNLFIDIENYLEKKLMTIACFKSQCKIRPYLQENMILATARYWGRFSNYGLVEPMEVIRQQ